MQRGVSSFLHSSFVIGFLFVCECVLAVGLFGEIGGGVYGIFFLPTR